MPHTSGENRTSKRVSMQYLKWSLGWTVQLGLLHRRVFTQEMMKANKRKSTLSPTNMMLIARGSEDYEAMEANELRRSRTADLTEYSINSESH